MNTPRLFKATTTVTGHREPFVDWFTVESEAEARRQWSIECERNGLPAEKTTATFVECDPQTLKPLEQVTATPAAAAVKPIAPVLDDCPVDTAKALDAIIAIAEGGVIERRETGQPTWYALEEIAKIARAIRG